MTDKMTIEQAIHVLKIEFRMGCGTCRSPKIIGNCEDTCSLKKAIDMAIEALEKQKWHKYVEEKPTKEGQYLCCKFNTDRPYFVVYWWSDDLYTVDEFDFLECKGKSGFYEYDSEWGYCEMDCSYWKPIDWESDTE